MTFPRMCSRLKHCAFGFDKSGYGEEVVALKIYFTIRGYVTTYFFPTGTKAGRLTKNIDRHLYLYGSCRKYFRIEKNVYSILLN